MSRRYRTYGPHRTSELKYGDSAHNHAIDRTAEVHGTSIISISQGTALTQRIGRKIVIKSIRIAGSCRLTNISGPTSYAMAYTWLILDTQANGAFPAIGDVFSDAGGQVQHFLNLRNVDRFRILKVFRWNLTSQAGVSGAYNTAVTPIDYYRKCSIPIIYSGTSGDIVERRSNNLFLISGCTANPEDDVATFTASIRIRYEDA